MQDAQAQYPQPPSQGKYSNPGQLDGLQWILVLQDLPCIKGPKVYAVSRCGWISTEQGGITLSTGHCSTHTAFAVRAHSWPMSTSCPPAYPGLVNTGVSAPWAHQELSCPAQRPLGPPPSAPAQDPISAEWVPGCQSDCSSADVQPCSCLQLLLLLAGALAVLGPNSLLAVSGAINEPSYQSCGTMPHGSPCWPRGSCWLMLLPDEMHPRQAA